MTPNEFRKLALSFPEAIESAHMRHPDFRVGGKIFATLGYPDDDWAMVKLTRDDQREIIRSDPAVFKSVKGAWGRQGRHKHLSAGGNDSHLARSTHRRMAQYRSETVVKESLAQTHSLTDALHYLIGNFVCALCAASEHIVDIRFML